MAYCLLELKNRGFLLDPLTYEALRTGYLREDFVFQVPSTGNVSVSEMNPATKKVSTLFTRSSTS